MDHDPFLSFSETARHLKINENTLRSWIVRTPKPNERPNPKRDKVRALTRSKISTQSQTVKHKKEWQTKYLFKESEVLKLKEELKKESKPQKGWGSSRHL